MTEGIRSHRLAMFCFLLLAVVRVVPATRSGLYQETDSVVVLDHTNFHSTISGREHAWLVEFYASWCGYCRAFSPVFKTFAGEVAAWGDVIKVAVIDCGDIVNAQTICNGANLTGYPTIKYYLPFAEQGDLGFNRLSQDHSAEGLLIDTISFVEQMIEEMVELNPNITHLWPDLRPMLSQNMSQVEVGYSQIWPGNAQYTFLIIEQQGSYIGRQIILDLWRRNNTDIVLRRFPLDEAGGEDILGNLEISSLPAVAVLTSRHQTVSLLSVRSEDKSGLEETISHFLAPANTEASSTAPEIVGETEPAMVEDDDIIRRRYTLYLNDLDKTVIFALIQEISIKQHLDEQAENSLREFIAILVKFYPSDSAVYHPISQIQSWLERQENIEPREISQMLQPVRDLAPGWVGCRGSQENFGGYSCGLWSLWHYLTTAQREAGVGDPRDVLRSMVSFVRNFFGCRECAEHFLQMVDNGTLVETEVNSFDDAVLFLWSKHNQVNLRLAGDATDDPHYPKTYFPRKKFCPDCYRGDTEEESASEREDILRFLVSHYSKTSLIRGTDFSTSFSQTVNLNRLLYLVEIMSFFIV